MVPGWWLIYWEICTLNAGLVKVSVTHGSAPNLSHGYNQSIHSGWSHLPWTQQEIRPPSDPLFPSLWCGGGKTHVSTALVMWETPNPTAGIRRQGLISHIKRASNSTSPWNLYLLKRQLYNQWTDGTGRKSDLDIFYSWLWELVKKVSQSHLSSHP